MQKDFDLKVMQYRQRHSFFGEYLPNDVTVECIRNVLQDTEALANAAAGTDASALISGKQLSANALAATLALDGKGKPHDAARNGKQ